MRTFFFRIIVSSLTLFLGVLSAEGQSQSTDLQGWYRFNDRTLDSLVALGQRQNADVQLMLSRVQEARIRVQIAETFLKPSVRAGINATTQSLAPNRPFPFPNVTDAQRQRFQLNTFSIPIDASYEIDLFKRIRQNIAATSLQAQATEADFRSMKLIVASEIARLYALVRANDTEQGVFRRNLLARDSTVAIIRERARVGLTSQIDAQRAETDIASLRVQLRSLERSRTELVNGLTQLCGQDPNTFTLKPGTLPATLPAFPFTSVSVEQLTRRPDLQAADWQTQAATAQINIAKAQRMPRISLVGSAGMLSGRIGPLLFPGSVTYLAGVNASVPVFEGGRNRQNIVLADQQQQTARLAYQQRLQVAQREAETALDNLTILRQQVEDQTQAVQLARRTEQYNRELYVRGLTTYLEVLDAQRTILSTEQALVQLQGQAFIQALALVRALGGDL